MRVPFFRVAERKEPKKGRPHCLRPLRWRYGATCGARVWRGLAQLAPLRVAQTHASPDPPNPALLGASRGDRGAEHPHGPLLRSAPHRGRKRFAPRRRGRAQQWPEWMLAVRLFGCPTPAGCACDGAVAGWHGRRSAHASCSDSPWMSERRARAQSEFHGAPRNRPDAGLPLRTAKGPQTGGRLFFGDFLLAKQKKVTRTPGDSRPPPYNQPCSPMCNSRPTQPSKTHYKINSYQHFAYER